MGGGGKKFYNWKEVTDMGGVFLLGGQYPITCHGNSFSHANTRVKHNNNFSKKCRHNWEITADWETNMPNDFYTTLINLELFCH